MKRIITFAAVALSAVFSFAGYEDWYTPAVDFKAQTADLTFWVGDKKIPMIELPLKAELLTVEAAVEQAVLKAGLSENAKTAFALGKRALSESLYAQLQSEMNRQKIDSLGASLETIFQLTNADKVDSNGAIISRGKLADGVRTKMLAKKNALIGGGETGGVGGEGGEAKPLQIQVTDFHYDTHEFEQIMMNGNKSKMGLKGYKDLRPIDNFPFSQGLFLQKGWIPFSEGFDGAEPNDLKWFAWGGLDTDILDVLAGTPVDDGKMSLKDWHGGTGGCELNVKGLLTNRESSDYQEARNTHMFLTRCKDGNDYKLHYMSVGGLIDSLTPVEPDEVSIETHINEDGTTNLCVYGVNEANEEAGSSEAELGFIPYVDGGETLAWAGFSEFFNENVFTTDENGKIILNGIEDAGEDDLMLVTAKGTSSEQSVKVKKLDGNAFDAGEGTDLTLRGFNDTYGDYLFEDSEIAGVSEIPVKVVGDTGYSLEWRVWGGVDGGIFQADEDSDHTMTLLGFKDTSHDCADSLDAMLTDESDGENRDKHAFLARYGTGTDATVHWVKINDVISQGEIVDGVSITTNSEDGAWTDGLASLYGFADADEEAGLSETDIGFIPYVNGGGTLEWAGFSEFFSDKVFNTTSEGRIILNGVSEEGSDKVRVLAVKGSGDEQAISTVAFDNASVDGSIENNQVIQMHNFSTAPSPYGGYSTLNFADALTNNSATIRGMSIPVRYPNGNRAEIGYIPMGKVTGIPSAPVDDLTIEASKDEGYESDPTAPDKLRIKGSKTATKGQILKMGDEGLVEWVDFPIEVDRPEGLEEDEYPLYITEADPEQDEPAKIGINGWETTDSPEGLYGAGNGKPVTYRFADIKSLEADADERTVELKGYADAGNYSIPFKDNDNGLGWISPLSSGSALLTMHSGSDPTATVLGNSVEAETISGKTTLNIKSFTNGGGCDTTMSSMMTEDGQASNRDHHQVLTRYSTGSGAPALHWVPMGEKIQASGGEGGAFAFWGNEGTATSRQTAIIVGSGSATNSVQFATATDSNVKVKCESDGSGGVKVTIGVYYK